MPIYIPPEPDRIMDHVTTIIRDRQAAMRREMDRRGVHLKQVHFDSGIPQPTLQSYLPASDKAQPAQMPLGALYALLDGKALPADILSLLLPPGWVLVREDKDDRTQVLLKGLRTLLANVESGDQR